MSTNASPLSDDPLGTSKMSSPISLESSHSSYKQKGCVTQCSTHSKQSRYPPPAFDRDDKVYIIQEYEQSTDKKYRVYKVCCKACKNEEPRNSGRDSPKEFLGYRYRIKYLKTGPNGEGINSRRKKSGGSEWFGEEELNDYDSDMEQA